jgi:hypothetical protein
VAHAMNPTRLTIEISPAALHIGTGRILGGTAEILLPKIACQTQQ